MTFEDDPWPRPELDGWAGDHASYIPPFFFDNDDTYGAAGEYFDGVSWWTQAENLEQELIDVGYTNPFAVATPDLELSPSLVATPSVSKQEPPKKRKLADDPVPKLNRKKSKIKQRGPTKSTNQNSNNNKDGRWAEQLLNPCAAAIAARNPSRVQHFLYVLHDLASLTGDANHRLAFHGLCALTHHHLTGGGACNSNCSCFHSSNPKFFRDSLIKFNDISPWFRIPNNVANTSILQILSEHQGNLHILDIGVSHGVQWPTLLEELTRRAGGPPPLIRLTVVAPASSTTAAVPFAHAPPGYDFTSKLLGFAKDLSINLQINKLESAHLPDLDPRAVSAEPDETLVVCAQFRLHSLSHVAPDDRMGFLRLLRALQPSGVVLSENEGECSCSRCGDFGDGFARRAEQLWRFLDSTSAAYKGRESDERRMMEGEAAKVLVGGGEMNERKERWRERMAAAGFRGEALWEETVEGARALLRKYDSNWEMKVEEKEGCVGLLWKGNPVSFCTLWKVDHGCA